MGTERKTRPLAEIVRKHFVGPFLLRCVAAGKKLPSAEAVKFMPVDEDEFVAELRLGDEYVRIYPVAAFKPKIGEQYNCLVRRRGGATVIEAIPAGYETMAGRQWQPNTVIANFEITFTMGENGRYWAKHPQTGQAILPHDEWKMPSAGKDGKIVVPLGAIELRPTCTRTFFVAGAVGKLSHVSHAALDVYEGSGDDKPDYSYAAQFRLFGRWLTAFEVVGNPFQATETTDTFTLAGIPQEAQDACTTLERWATRELLPLLHPDAIANRGLDAATNARTMEIAEETRYNLKALTEWFKGWVDFTIQDLERRKIAGRPLKVKIPEPITGGPKKRIAIAGLLIKRSRRQLESMLFKPARSAPTAEEPPVKPASAPARTETKPAKKPVRSVKKSRPPKVNTVPLAESNPAAFEKLAKKKREVSGQTLFETIFSDKERGLLAANGISSPQELLDHVEKKNKRDAYTATTTGISNRRLSTAAKKIRKALGR